MEEAFNRFPSVGSALLVNTVTKYSNKRKEPVTYASLNATSNLKKLNFPINQKCQVWPWLPWLTELSVGLQTERSLV